MTDLQTLLRAVDELSGEELKLLYSYILDTRIQFVDNLSSARPPMARILGLHEQLGQAWMSDDFDAELPDSFWFGEDAG